MNNEDERFEKYLRTFSGTELPAALARTAVDRARRQRTVWFGAVSSLLATAAVIVIAVWPGSTHRIPVAPISSRTEIHRDLSGCDAVDTASLTLAYCRDGLDGLEAQLDCAGKRFSPVTDANDMSEIRFIYND